VNKKKQKNFDSLGALAKLSPHSPFSKSFLPRSRAIYFFKKETLALLTYGAASAITM
jgi:hypothetical protein